ncbi:tannase/feruloyl esterase family alpha/beta hydrolase [Sphingopyxis granuli]|uniref:tannase/feruloyl esterase family alpha/beta hydrolase n=1 Tax=Sphingopyxis granuli TaxID=267128 RepID=UPI00301D64A9
MRTTVTRLMLLGAIAASASVAAAEETGDASSATTLRCDESMKAQFKPDAMTTVISVEQVRKGDTYPNPTMEQMVFASVPAVYGADLCHVKLLIGPGNPGPADAPSTSKGIGIEVWLPAKAAWNHRIHAIGGSGGTGSNEAVPGKISEWTGAIDTRNAPRVAADEGAVTSTTDSGRGTDRSGSSWMYPDGSTNYFAIRDWNYRSLYEQAVKTKALARAFYGEKERFAYFDGASGGGRQALHIAQKLPEQYDGIVAGVPALAYAETTAHSYPGLVIVRDLAGKPLSKEQLFLVSNAAIAQCDLVGGKHLGFVLDNRACRYDPTKDRAVLCAADGGRNKTPACLSPVQAQAVNKFWYGPTRDGSVPDPAIDNGWDTPIGGNRLWYGLPRGTDLTSWAMVGSVLGMDAAAVILADSSVTGPGFKNATGDGKDSWKNWTYEEFGRAFDRLRDGEDFLEISSDNPDLDALRAHGGKLMLFVHLNDSILPPQPAIAYYDKVAARMGGASTVQSFYRQYMIPGQGHGGDGTANPASDSPAAARGQAYGLLVDWVEKAVAPDNIVFRSRLFEGEDAKSMLDRSQGGRRTLKSLPVCAYPASPTYVSGDIYSDKSYVCR